MQSTVNMRSTIKRERGSILPLVALAMLMAGASVILLGRMGGAATARAGARNAADAAALLASRGQQDREHGREDQQR